MDLLRQAKKQSGKSAEPNNEQERLRGWFKIA